MPPWTVRLLQLLMTALSVASLGVVPSHAGAQTQTARGVSIPAESKNGAGSPGRLVVNVVDYRTGEPTPFRAIVTDAAGTAAELPDEAVAIMYGHWDRAGGYGYQPDSAFYANGGFGLELPPGRYRLTISKGYEYLAQQHELEVGPGENVSREFRLERWIDMPSRGWYSVDGHIHLRRSPREDPLILTWIAAEDIHVGALLQMGDFWASYYPQYAWGKDGVYQIEDRLLTSGQEDPRTHELGHTISLGADEYVRFRGEYYYYDRVFDRVRELGGVSGYAHQGVLFHGYRGLTLDVLRGKVDFLEILQFCNGVGPLEVEHYYHFLDLGFKLTATAGSDFPWCGKTGEADARIGNARFYTYVGDPFTFDRWRESLRAGHTFVSSGPVIELTVDGRIPGEELRVAEGETVIVRARAYGHAGQVPLEKLEVVAHGKVLQAVTSGDAGQSADELALEMELPVEHGLWIAARASAGPTQFAHTTPIYVTTGSGFHNPETALQRLELSERYLREIEEVVAEPNRTYDHHAWRFACPAEEPGCVGEGLEERIAATRRVIAELREKFSSTPGLALPR
jgi:hypothetical protein